MDMEEETAWSTRSRAIAYSGHTTLVNHTVRLKDGTELNYEVDESVPFAVAVLVIDGDDVILSRQYRYPLRRWIYDLPGGGGREGETPVAAAMREVEEELGIIPVDLRPLHTFSMNPGRSAWPVYLFVSTSGVRPGAADLSDGAEQVRLVRMTISELDALIAKGEIVDPALFVARAMAAASGVLPPIG